MSLVPGPSILLREGPVHLLAVGSRHDEVTIAIIPGGTRRHHLVEEIGGCLGHLLLALHLPHLFLEGVILGQLRRSLLLLEAGLFLFGLDLGLGAAALRT